MAIPWKAKVLKTEQWNEDTVHLSCEMLEPSELGFVGGQYIIVNSGKILPNGKLGKRAYSIPSADSQQHRFDLAVKKISQGIGSNFMHDLKVGDTFEFSGPWGKYKPGSMANEKILCVATDTGITAALGLLRGKWMSPILPESRFIWLVSSEDYFLPLKIVNEWLPQKVNAAFPVSIPPIGTESRISVSIEKIEQMIGQAIFSKIYLSGDGFILSELKNFFLNKGYLEEQIIVETFFHHASLKSTSTV